MLHVFFPFSPVSLIELSSFWNGLKELFTLHTLADKVKILDWVKGRVTVAYHHLWEEDTFKKVVDNNILRYNIPCAVNTYMTANGVTFNM